MVDSIIAFGLCKLRQPPTSQLVNELQINMRYLNSGLVTNRKDLQDGLKGSDLEIS